jgi:carboxypeptidase family protein/concanavalin A-like lectin/glucanase superfamily protein
LLGLLSVGSAQGQTGPLVLISETNSSRAIALESITFTREPFPVTSLISWSSDNRTRVIIFALNLQLQPGEEPSSVIADAEDGMQRHYELQVEYVEPVPGQEWMSAVSVKLSDQMGDVGDVLVRIVHNGQASNRVRIAVGLRSAGPPDDPGTNPTPAPPYVIRGRVTADGGPLADATLTLNGSGSVVTTTDSDGNYSILASSASDFNLSVSKAFYDFNPPSRAFTNLSNHRDGIEFTATRQKRTVQGQVRNDNNQPLPNLEVLLTNDAIPTTRMTTTDNAGSFSFTDVPAGFGYTVTPTNSIFAFTPQSIVQLVENTTLTFTGARRSYMITGSVIDQGGSAIGGATVELNPSGVSVTTDELGHYLFLNVAAGFDYTVVTRMAGYLFQPPSTALTRIDGNRSADFTGIPQIILSGRVADADGRGVFGVKVSVSGTQTGTTSTRSDGTYSFLVTSFGNYVLTSSKEQNYYEFAPQTVTLTGQQGSRSADFAATLEASVTPSHVLEFDGARKSVDYSMPKPGDYLFWPGGVEHGHFFWEFWAMPGINAGGTYLVSDGYGGAHAILFGFGHFGTREPGRYQLTGNVWNGNNLTSFGSDEGPATNEWGHFAVGWDGTNIVTYFNGVPVGKKAFAGPRITPGGNGGTGRLLIGGSDHANLVGRIAQVRGFERNNPRAQMGSSVFAAYAPQTVFSIDGNLLSYFFRPSLSIADLSLYGHRDRQNPGLVRSTANGVLHPCDGCPLPQFVIDPTAPDFAHPNQPGPISAPVDTPAAVPIGVLIFDSFSRPNSTYVLNGLGGLGSSEGGILGPRTWVTNAPTGLRQPFGILNGRAVLLANATALAWVNASSDDANFDIRVDRGPRFSGTGHNTGISFRVVDSNNYFFAYSSDGPDASQPQTLTLGHYVAGVRTVLASGASLPISWTTMRVVTTGAGVVEVYADDTLVYSTISSLLSNSDGMGLYNNGPGLSLTNRWDNFLVFTAHP